MYVAKAQQLGVVAYDPAADGHSPARLALLGDLRRALDVRQLVLHYQPKVSTATGDVVGAEALVRWQHPHRGLVSPDAFIPLAEQTGLIGPLTGVRPGRRPGPGPGLADAGRAAAGRGQPLGPQPARRGRCPQQVADLLARHGVPASLLELEVTESALMTEPARARRLLEQLAGLGVRHLDRRLRRRLHQPRASSRPAGAPS